VFAIRGPSIVDIDVAHPEEDKDLRWPHMDDLPKLLLGQGRDNAAGVAVLTMSSRVLAITPGDGATAVLTAPLAPAEVLTVRRHLGACGRRVIYEGEQKGAGQTTRTDIFIREVTTRIGRSLTSTSPGSVHSQPAFSHDCRKVVLVSDEK
jgi:hypothetical protein